MQEPRYVRHIPTGRRHVWHELYNQDEFEPWVEAVADDTCVTVVSIKGKSPRTPKAGLALSAPDAALSADASRGLL